MVNGSLITLLTIINFDVSSSIYRFKESIRHVYRTVRASVSYRKSEVSEYTTSCKRNSNNKLKTFKRKELK